MTAIGTRTAKLANPALDNPALDNPAWHALITRQAHVARGDGRARAFERDVSVFAGLDSLDDEAWDALAPLAVGGVVIARAGAIEPPSGWRASVGIPGRQMILAAPVPDIELPEHHRLLSVDDVPAMLELVALTEPGPFAPRTIEFGGFTGIFEGDRLMAMAGRRLSLPGYVEVSGVCTHPDAQRRGYAAALTAHVARGIAADGDTPILHVKHDNVRAQRVYEALGFAVRARLTFAFVTPPASPLPPDRPAGDDR